MRRAVSRATGHGPADVVIYNRMVVDLRRPSEEPPGDGTDRVFHALGDATRRDIVAAAVDGRHSVSSLARRYPMSLAAVQKHIAVLERAGLVIKERRGREARVRTEIAAVRRAGRTLDALEDMWQARIGRFEVVLTQANVPATPDADPTADHP